MARDGSQAQNRPGLPEGFVFSQGSLQDFVDCPRRFELRYLYGLAWPAIQSEPALENERIMQRGALFHRLAHQRLLGLEAEGLSALIHEDDLRRWWERFLNWEAQTLAPQPAARRYPELSLWAPLAGYRLTAKLDLVLCGDTGQGNRFTIYDWKTGAKRPRRAWLAERLQTRVYPYLLAAAGAHLNGGAPIPPEQVTMSYWFAEFPDQPERFAYSPAAFERDRDYLAALVGQIERMAGMPEALLTDGGVRAEEEASLGAGSRAAAGGMPALGAFPLTSSLGRCAFCVYRSLCERGEGAGLAEEAGEAGTDWETPGAGEGALPHVSIDFEHIVEIEF